jgi:hypothetical protein
MVHYLLQGPEVVVKLKRMATSDIQDRRRMFELFSALKVCSICLNNRIKAKTFHFLVVSRNTQSRTRTKR